MTKPYMKPGLQTEDPIDGKWPPKHKSQKHGARQRLARDADEDFGDGRDEPRDRDTSDADGER